jgi:AbiU2
VNGTELEELVGSSIDHKNIELAKTLFSLRHDLDIHCLIGVNASQLNKHSPGKFFFGHVAMRILESIILAICKVYEDEKRYELNSIQGVLNSLSHKAPSLKANEREVRDFMSQYGVPSGPMDPMEALQATFDGFKTKYASELDRFKTARDKLVAHSEFGVARDSLPSFDTMENLFFFGADFYMIVGNSFVGSGPENLKNRREIKRDFEKILRLVGLQDIKTELK